MAEGDLSVHQAIVEIINEMGGIGKTGVNEEQHYNFRGIDAVLQVLHPLFAKYGVYVVPQVTERIYEERVSGKGTKGHACHLRVDFIFYGPAGDQVCATTWGEAVDYSDKATNKAMTAAFKYALFQVFAICDPMEDGDSAGDDGGGDETPLAQLVNCVNNSGLPKGVCQDIIQVAVGHSVRDMKELNEAEIVTAMLAMESAIADAAQLQGEK